MSAFEAPKRVAWGLLLLRILVGWVFLSERIQKFSFPVAICAGRLAKIGIPMPQFIGPFVGIMEILCGTLLIFGLFITLVTVPLLIDIAVALLGAGILSLDEGGDVLGDSSHSTALSMLSRGSILEVLLVLLQDEIKVRLE